MLDTTQLTSFELYILKEALKEYKGAPFERVYIDAERELREGIKKEWNDRVLRGIMKNL
jgi:hypothetical protein